MRKILRLLMLILMVAWGTESYAKYVKIQADEGEGTVWKKVGTENKIIQTIDGDITLTTNHTFVAEGFTGVWKFCKGENFTITSNVGAIAHVYFSCNWGNSDELELASGCTGTYKARRWKNNKWPASYAVGCWRAADKSTKSVTIQGKTDDNVKILWIRVDYVGDSDVGISNLNGEESFTDDSKSLSFSANYTYSVSGTKGATPSISANSSTKIPIDYSCYVSARQEVSLSIGNSGSTKCDHMDDPYATYSKTYEKHFIKRYKQTVSSSGYATFCHYNNMVVPSGCTAYTYKTADGKSSGVTTKTALVPSKTYSANSNSTIPAGEAVIVKASAGEYYFTNPDGDGNNGATKDDDNDLTGNPSSSDNSDYSSSAGLYYYLMYRSDSDHTLGFYWGAKGGAPLTSGNAHKAWLVLASGVAAKGFTFYLPDDESAPTAIEGIRTDNAVDDNAPMYNAAGQRVGASYKGIVIQNGRKFIKK